MPMLFYAVGADLRSVWCLPITICSGVSEGIDLKTAYVFQERMGNLDMDFCTKKNDEI